MGTSNAAIAGAIITASVAVIMAIVTQVWTSLRSRTDRQYTARRAGIVDAQDAMLELRDALAAYGVAIRPVHQGATTDPIPVTAPEDSVESRKRTATGRFLACVSRVHDSALFDAMMTWRSAAERRFISVEEVTAAVEDEWFGHVQDLSRAALMSSTGTTRATNRKGLAPPSPLPGG